MTSDGGQVAFCFEPIPAFTYRLRNTGHSSARFGPCEVCGKPVSEVFIQTEFQAMQVDERDEAHLRRAVERGEGFHNGCTFGHEACLESIQKTGAE
jgi:hypothetical protein